MATAELVDDEQENIIDPVESMSTLAALNRSEIDTQIATAKQFPRSIRSFQSEALAMVTLTEEIAGECTYALPARRGSNKKIMGPSARFAEIVACAWGNCRAGARIVEEQERFVVAQGVFNDVQRNVVITYEVRRRITNSKGERYGDDMIGVTSNAACSIAMRNAVLKGVPKAFWKKLHDESMRTARGDATTLAQRRTSLINSFVAIGIKPEQVFALVDVKGVEDVTLDHLLELRSIYTAIKDGDTTIDDLLGNDQPVGSKVKKSDINDKLKDVPPADNAGAPSDEELKKAGLFTK